MIAETYAEYTACRHYVYNVSNCLDLNSYGRLLQYNEQGRTRFLNSDEFVLQNLFVCIVCFIVYLLGCLLAWLLGYLVACLLGCLVTWLLGWFDLSCLSCLFRERFGCRWRQIVRGANV